MIRSLYAIRDTVARSIVGGVHVHAHDAPAVRMFSDIASSEGTALNQHLQDFELLCIGKFDDETGALEPDHMDVVVVLTGSALKASWEAAAQQEQQRNG